LAPVECLTAPLDYYDGIAPRSVYMSIYDQVLDFIDRPDAARFERLALAVFAYQFANVGPYREFCLNWSISPETVVAVADLPPVSTAAFKHVAFCAGSPERIFLTSGTTRGRDQRGRHLVPDLRLYQASALKHLARMLFPDRCRPRMLALHPTADRMPESSLSQMISWCFEGFGGARTRCCATPQQVDSQAAFEFLRAAETMAEPVCILTTTAALSALFEYLRLRGPRLNLAAGSRLMDTGGAKGQATPLTAAEVLEMAQHYLAIPPAYVINEYGMTELSSQLYDATPLNCPGASESADRVKIAPPWLKVIARDPATLRPVAPGQTGLLSFFDLANAGSVSALLTEDLGTVNADGTVRIFGRIIGSDPRGCALSIEQFAGASHPQPNSLLGQGEGGEIGRGEGEVGSRNLIRLEGTADPSQCAINLTLASDSLSLTRERVGLRVPSAQSGKSDSLREVASHLRVQARERLIPQRIAEALARACDRWRKPGFDGRAATLAAAVAATGQSQALLAASIDALLANFTLDAMMDLVRRLSTCDRLIGFVMPGNVMGAGLHELVQALIGGASVIVKASSLEPLFFPGFHRTLQTTDADVAARMRVAIWDRSDSESTTAMARECDRIVAFGDDDTIAALDAIAGPKLIGFGSRLSGALLSREAISAAHARSTAAAIARDVSLFDQRGCLSLHHIFVETRQAADAHNFAELLAAEMADLAQSMPPGRNPPMAEMTAARAMRENARWRRIGGEPVALWEGEDLAWAVIFDPDANFQPSPLCRTVCVSALKDDSELRRRLADAAGALEGFAVADPANRLEAARAILCEMGVSYFCAPGQMQSPPPSWPHGGGRFLRLLERADG
jgi:hypothetical protein